MSGRGRKDAALGREPDGSREVAYTRWFLLQPCLSRESVHCWVGSHIFRLATCVHPPVLLHKHPLALAYLPQVLES